MRTLVLDQGYQPCHIVPWQRAVVMLFGGKVELVDTYDELIRSVSLTIHMPAVVRLTRRTRPRRHPIRFSRRNVLLRDAFTCQYCRAVLAPHELTYDHVLPRTRGGRTCWENIVAACRPCNHKKGDRTPAEAGMKLARAPVKPAWLAATTLHVAERRMPDPWKTWVPPGA